MLNPRLNIDNKILQRGSKPYIIAEIGVNHEADIDKAKQLIDLAKEGGADAAKFQSYKAEKLASKNSPSYWDTSLESTKSQYELFKKYDKFGEKEYIQLADHCKKQDISFLSTPFDHDSIDFLNNLMPFYKIASADLTNIPLLRKVSSKDKPIVLSTGACNMEEIKTALETISKCNKNPVSLLHCILNYPTLNKNANLLMIESLRTNFPQTIIGYSDHTIPNENMSVLTSSYVLGALIIEKHFTDDKTQKGNDHYHSMDVNDLKIFKRNVNYVREMMGNNLTKQPIANETISRENARRSIVINKKLKKGDEISERNITYKRPGTGISTIFWDKVIGRKINKSLSEDHILQWNDLEKN